LIGFNFTFSNKNKHKTNVNNFEIVLKKGKIIVFSEFLFT